MQQLKPCIKQRAKSNPASPPGERKEPIKEGLQSLRRIKTVDFDEQGSKPISVPPDLTTRVASHGHGRFFQRNCNSGRPTKVSSPCPINLSTAKSSVSHPAITRTDVHVIAIAPSANTTNCSEEDNVDPATPTMQVVESNAGRHEIVWDDVPSDQGIGSRGQRLSSSAGEALEKFNAHGNRGLERVNTKLANWSGTWNSPSSGFKPTIVVFPDDDSYKSQYYCPIDDDDDLTMLAPPNSQKTSAAPSRHQSRPTSAPRTRMASEVEEASQVVLPEPRSINVNDSDLAPEHQLLVPSGDGRVAHGSRRRVQTPAARKLSNIEDEEMKFRGHRDSVTIARSRLLRNGGVLPELIAHGDSVPMARKRMHARNHVTSAARETPQVQNSRLNLYGLNDDTMCATSLETVKAHAFQALKKSCSESMLRSQEK